MKRILATCLCFAVVLVAHLTSAQDVAININAVPPSIEVSQTGNVNVRLTNNGVPDQPAPAGRLEPQVSVGNNVRINTDGSGNPIFDNPSFSVVSFTPGVGGSITLRYNQELPVLGAANVNIQVIGVNVGGPSVVTGTLNFNGPQTPGNDPSNDNSTTSFTVTEPLPVTWADFRGEWRKDEGSVLSWSTFDEKDNAYFEIQRSDDAKGFEAIGRVAGRGTISTQQFYRFVDTESPAEINYYRLRQVDRDGKFAFSKVISVRRGIESLSMKLFPNPSAQKLSLEVRGAGDVEAVRVLDQQGRTVQTYGPVTDLDVSQLSVGVYIIEVRTSTHKALRQRFVRK